MSNESYVPFNSFCVDCGKYTTLRGPFGEYLCTECWTIQDSDISAFESNQPYN